MAFPTNPNTGNTFVLAGKTFRWDGAAWAKVYGGLNNDFYPSVDEGYSLGTISKKWANLYLSGNTIVLGNTKIQSSGDGSIAIRSTNTQVTSTISFSSNGYIASEAGTYTTANVPEQGNLYFTNTRVIYALTAGANISIASNGRITALTQGGGGGASTSDSKKISYAYGIMFGS